MFLCKSWVLSRLTILLSLNIYLYIEFLITDKISSYLPLINTISGMLFYTFILYALGVLVKCCFAKTFNSEDSEEDKTLNNKMNEDFKRRLEEKRKKKAEDAQKILNKIQ